MSRHTRSVQDNTNDSVDEFEEDLGLIDLGVPSVLSRKDKERPKPAAVEEDKQAKKPKRVEQSIAAKGMPCKHMCT